MFNTWDWVILACPSTKWSFTVGALNSFCLHFPQSLQPPSTGRRLRIPPNVCSCSCKLLLPPPHDSIWEWRLASEDRTIKLHLECQESYNGLCRDQRKQEAAIADLLHTILCACLSPPSVLSILRLERVHRQQIQMQVLVPGQRVKYWNRWIIKSARQQAFLGEFCNTNQYFSVSTSFPTRGCKKKNSNHCRFHLGWTMQCTSSCLHSPPPSLPSCDSGRDILFLHPLSI